MFFVRSRHGDFCSSVSFHNKGGMGYGTDISRLRLWSFEEAQQALRHDIKSLPLLASEVNKHAVMRVDMQYLDGDIGCPVDKDSDCVIQISGIYDGNDIKFKNEAFGTFDLKNATVVSFDVAVSNITTDNKIWLLSHIKMIARPTFQASNIDLKTMVRDPGIKYDKPRKAKATTGKTRGNCPDCGKITWGFDPEENEYCPNCFA